VDLVGLVPHWLEKVSAPESTTGIDEKGSLCVSVRLYNKTWIQESFRMSDSTAVIKRTDRGTFPAGVSGNPSGRPRADVDVISLARQHTPNAIATLAMLMADKNQSGAVRMQCAVALLDRGHGRPMQSSVIGIGVVDHERRAELQFLAGQLKDISFTREMFNTVDAELIESDDGEI
jgi:hypothetical protein